MSLQCNIQELIDRASKKNQSEIIDTETKCGDCGKMKAMEKIPFSESNICIQVSINVSIHSQFVDCIKLKNSSPFLTISIFMFRTLEVQC